jgi:predicted AAA+ superfamily ATPase
MITEAVKDEDSLHDLLGEIASIWITRRGHSKACRVKEELMRAKASGKKGKYSLRKELDHVSKKMDKSSIRASTRHTVAAVPRWEPETVDM